MRWIMVKAWEICGGESGYRCVGSVCYRACALCVVAVVCSKRDTTYGGEAGGMRSGYSQI